MALVLPYPITLNKEAGADLMAAAKMGRVQRQAAPVPPNPVTLKFYK